MLREVEMACHEEMCEEEDNQDHEQHVIIAFPIHVVVESTLALSEVF